MMLAAGPGFTVPEVSELLGFKPFFSFAVAGITFHVTFVTVVMFLLSFLVGGLFVAAFRRASVVPSPMQNMFEAGVDAVREQIVLPILGPEGDRWLPFLASIFFFVFALNFMEVIPGISFPITSHMAIPVFLSLMVYVIFNVVGIRKQGVGPYFKGILFPPGVPKPIYIILTPIEFASTFIFRPLTLAVRLFANMMAGHVMLTIFFLASGYFLYRSESLFLHVLTPFPVALAIILVIFEMFIGLIQAFIITILSAVYIGGALHPEH
jgi:F-type H+-transporting ATPase subunit a